jgi:hypothetical protein
MNPDATNRIVNQQIKEWHASREEDRNARLLEDESSRRHVAVGTAVTWIAAAVSVATASLRRRLRHRLAA